jgi:ABC-type Fe3+/spermidine/putrescine transport system ATPase subunit
MNIFITSDSELSASVKDNKLAMIRGKLTPSRNPVRIQTHCQVLIIATFFQDANNFLRHPDIILLPFLIQFKPEPE